jgi:predicted ATP-grasp superfamily ATP-dependent carboligase
VTEFNGLPELRAPIAIAAFEGWNDAADSATAAIEHLDAVWDARLIGAIDPDDYYDFQVTRPVISLVDGETRRIDWPTTQFLVASPPDADRDIVLIRGIEPNMRWKAFSADILEFCHSLGVERIVLLGALLADVPYTRPLPVSGTSTNPVEAEQLGLTGARYEGPTGIVGVLHEAATRAEVDVVSFWSHVPHYASNPPCPKATVALLSHIEELLDLPVPLAGLAEEVVEWERRITALAEEDNELSEYVRQLEQREGDAGLRPLSGDEIAREFEKYLRRRGGSDGQGLGVD